jgi:hypothetical protein
MKPAYSLTDNVDLAEVVALYEANGWSSAKKPQQLLSALRNSETLATARLSGRLVGLGNAISDGQRHSGRSSLREMRNTASSGTRRASSAYWPPVISNASHPKQRTMPDRFTIRPVSLSDYDGWRPLWDGYNAWSKWPYCASRGDNSEHLAAIL